MQKAKRDDFRLEEELRSAKAKYEESSDDVFRRMQDIKDAEADSIRDLTRFLDAELDYHERCAEELRRTRRSWTASASSPTGDRDRGDYGGGSSMRRPSGRSRSNTAQSFGRTNSHNAYDDYDEPDDLPAQNMRVPIRSQSRISINSAASNQDLAPAPRPSVARSNTYQSERSLGASLSRTTSATSTPLSVAPPPQANFSSLRGQLRPTARTSAMDVFADHDDDTSSDTPPRSASPATSYGSSNRSGAYNTATGKKAPPPPPSRAKKPPPPVPVRREVGY